MVFNFGSRTFIFAVVVRPLQLRYNKPVRKCGHCGSGGLKRVHRTFLERFSYLAIYECRDCENEEFVPRRYTYHLGEQVRCPGCGTYRVTRLRALDKIDKMAAGPLNILERLAGGSLYHCCFCRIQFYDRRKMAPRVNVQPVPGEPEIMAREAMAREATGRPGTASSDV